MIPAPEWRAEDQGPGLHALVIGLGEYPFLPAPDGVSRPEQFRLSRVDGPAVSAWRVARFLLAPDGGAGLTMPLRSLRLALAPTPADKLAEPALEGWAGELPGLEMLADLAEAWRRDCEADDANASFFFFSGHGLRYDAEDLLVLGDFGKGAGPTNVSLRRCVRRNQLLSAMSGPAIAGYAMARRQFWFVDACRNRVGDDLPGEVGRPGDLLSEREPGGPDVVSGGIASAAAGTAAFAAGKDGGTAFGSALLTALGGAFNEAKEVPGLGRAWPVTPLSLLQAVGALLDRDVATRGQRPKNLGDWMEEPLLLFRTAPAVAIRLAFTPPGGPDGITSFKLFDVERAGPPRELCPFQPPQPFAFSFPGGNYTAEITVQGRDVQRASFFASLIKDEWQVPAPANGWVQTMASGSGDAMIMSSMMSGPAPVEILPVTGDGPRDPIRAVTGQDVVVPPGTYWVQARLPSGSGYRNTPATEVVVRAGERAMVTLLDAAEAAGKQTFSPALVGVTLGSPDRIRMARIGSTRGGLRAQFPHLDDALLAELPSTALEPEPEGTADDASFDGSPPDDLTEATSRKPSLPAWRAGGPRRSFVFDTSPAFLKVSKGPDVFLCPIPVLPGFRTTVTPDWLPGADEPVLEMAFGEPSMDRLWRFTTVRSLGDARDIASTLLADAAREPIPPPCAALALHVLLRVGTRDGPDLLALATAMLDRSPASPDLVAVTVELLARRGRLAEAADTLACLGTAPAPWPILRPGVELLRARLGALAGQGKDPARLAAVSAVLMDMARRMAADPLSLVLRVPRGQRGARLAFPPPLSLPAGPARPLRTRRTRGPAD